MTLWDGHFLLYPFYKWEKEGLEPTYSLYATVIPGEVPCLSTPG